MSVHWSKALVEIRFRIIVTGPPPGVTFRVQRGRADLLAPSSETATSLALISRSASSARRTVRSGSSGRSRKARQPASHGLSRRHL